MSTSIDPRAIYADAKESDPEQILIFRVGRWFVCYDDDAREIAALLGKQIDLHLEVWPQGILVKFHPGDLEPLLTRIVEAGRRASVLEPVKSAGGEAVERIVMEGQP